MNEIFKATTQYNDYKGTAAADDHDTADMSALLRQKGMLGEGEIVVGVKMFSGEVHDQTQDKPVFVHVYIAGPSMDSFAKQVEVEDPVTVRVVDLEMHLNEFFGLFKRFEVAISRHGVLTGRNTRR